MYVFVDVVTDIKTHGKIKLWWIQRDATLWLEMTPTMPITAAWSAHSFLKFSWWHSRAAWWVAILRWAWIKDCWPACAPCTCARAYEKNPNKIYSSRVNGPWNSRKNKASIMTVISTVLLECVLTSEKVIEDSMVTTGKKNQTSIRPWRIGKSHVIQQEFLHQQRENSGFEWTVAQKRKKKFSIADGRFQPLWRRSGHENIHFGMRHRPIRGESNIGFLRVSERSLPESHDSFPDAG